MSTVKTKTTKSVKSAPNKDGVVPEKKPRVKKTTVSPVPEKKPRVKKTTVSPVPKVIHQHLEIDESDGFRQYDFDRENGQSIIDALKIKVDVCDECYKQSADYRNTIGVTEFDNQIDQTFIDKLQYLIHNKQLKIMDKESMVAFTASSVMRYKGGLLIANER